MNRSIGKTRQASGDRRHARRPALAGFAQLHPHSCYSLLDTKCKIDALARRAAALNQPAPSLTHYAVVTGAVELQQAGHHHGIKPILGCGGFLVDAHSSGLASQPSNLILAAEDNAGCHKVRG